MTKKVKTLEQLKILSLQVQSDQDSYFKLLVKKENPDLYYKVLDILGIAKRKRNKVQECDNCGYIYVGKKPEDCRCFKMKEAASQLKL